MTGDYANILTKLDEHKFDTYATQWYYETGMLSSISKATKHSAYQEIIKMGDVAVIIILNKLYKQPKQIDHWFYALEEITGESPVLFEHIGNLKLAAQDWVEWGKNRGFIK